MTDGQTAIAVIVLMAGLVISITGPRLLGRIGYITREQHLQQQVAQLEANVAMLLTKFSDASKELVQVREVNDQMQRDLMQANRRIAELTEELGKARLELANAQARIKELEQARGGGLPSERRLLVGIGSDKALQVDLASLRQVQARTDLRFSRVMPATFDALRRTLQRYRSAGMPIQYVHLSVHASPQGVMLADGVVDGLKLSEILAGVDVLVIAGCSSDAVGDLLGAARHVISMREAIAHDDARVFTEIFWTAIGEGLKPQEAFNRVLDRAPASVAEFVEMV